MQSKVHQTKKATIEIGQWVVAADMIFLLSGAVQHLPAAIHAPSSEDPQFLQARVDSVN
jgi:hypothetical protein